jgi:hypothetical protein
MMVIQLIKRKFLQNISIKCFDKMMVMIQKMNATDIFEAEYKSSLGGF